MTYVDVHLVVDSFDRQFNTWRNIARLFARTEYVMMLDIDFYPCTDFRDVVRQALNSTMLEKLNAGRAALVIPAFEYSDFHEGTRYVDFPSNKTVSCLQAKLSSLPENAGNRLFFPLSKGGVSACSTRRGRLVITARTMKNSMLHLQETYTR